MFKVYAVVGPFIWVALADDAGLQGSTAMMLMTLGDVVAFIVLVFVGFSQLSSGSRKPAHSCFIYAGIALFWILVEAFLLLRLAST